MDNYHSMSPSEGHYSQQQQQQQSQQVQQQQQHQSQQSQQQPPQRQWPPHLLPPTHQGQSSFPSPVSPQSTISEHGSHYPPFYHNQQQQQSSSISDNMHIERSALSLNLSSLTVASPTNLSPINPPSSHPASALSPVTPISPGGGSGAMQHPFSAHHHGHHMPSHSQFQFTVPEPPQSQGSGSAQQGSSHGYDDHSPHFDRRLATTPTTSRSSSSSTSSTTSISISLPRKRSFTSNASTLVEEPMYDETPMELASYEDMGAYGGAGQGGSGSPVDGSTDGGEEVMGMGIPGIGMGVGGSLNVLGKPMATNNFVTKLYQMINDSKSAHFIAWTELGTSFVVSNVGEFSRSILGSHFKHNNFSSFVRQLNMYGFHKINRTPRNQRTSTDAQTWEFSHHKFLRGRPDLLDEIKRKALEPDPGVKHRVELPGEVAAQLGAMRDENRRVWEQLAAERRRVEKLVGVVGRLWDVVGKGFPGSVPPFPADMLETESPNIYITSPTATSSRYPPPLSMNLHTMHSLSSPNSSPTGGDFPLHNQIQSLSRQSSFQHVSFSRSETGASSTPLPSSPNQTGLDLYDGEGEPIGRGNPKRQRTSNECLNGVGEPNSSSPANSTKRLARARSDSAPLGHGLAAWQTGGVRPRSGSGIGPNSRMMGLGIPNIGTMTRNAGPPPMLPLSNQNGSPSR